MLQAIQEKAATWVVRVLAVLLILSFGAWGIGDMIRGKGLKTDVAEVGDTKITANEFNAAFRRQLERLRQVLGPEVDSEQARKLGVADTTLDNLISERLLNLRADDLGIVVGDDQIRQHIMAEPAFHGLDGSFDPTTFKNALAQRGLSEQRYVDDLRNQLKLSYLTGAVASGSEVPNLLADSIYRYRNDKRTARYLVVPDPAPSSLPAPTEAELREFHKKNAAQFTAPERRDVTAIYLDPKAEAKRIHPAEADLRTEYESRLASLSIPERREISQILVGDEAKARDAIARLKRGEKIAEVAKAEASLDQGATSLGLVTKQDLPEDISKVAFALPLHTPSEPVHSPLGWHVLVVEKIIPGKTPTFEEARAKIATDVAREQAVDALVKLSNQLEDAVAGGATLEEAAGQLKAELIKLKALEANGKAGPGSTKTDLLRNQRFIKTVFDTPEGELSDLVETSLDGYYMVRVDRITPPALKPFETVKAEVEAAWRQDRLKAAAKKTADAAVARLKEGTTIDKVAADLGLKVGITRPFTRFDQDKASALPASLAAEIFHVKPGQAVSGPTDKGYVVAVLDKVEPADPKANAKALDGVRAELRQAIAQDLLTEYTKALRRIYPVSIDTAALDRLFDEGTLNR